ncbi:MAG: Glutamate synthase [NADPH] large chain [Ignavibacteriae bacterium]|nr:MAG: Glutamate synthase [NADPH] large chain [Ignavibacteriota bacterium]
MTEPKIVQKAPFVLELNSGKYAWCACGLSANQPFCDGSHKSTNITPIVFEINDKTKIALCGCKHTKNKPKCDGTHKNL